MRKLLLTIAAGLMIAAPAYADGVAGKWTGEIQGRNGTNPVTLELKASGSTLSGSMTTGNNPSVDIADGTVSGSKVSFTTTRSFQGYDITTKWSGEAKGDDLTLNREINLPAGAMGGNGPPPTPPPVTLHREK